MKKKAITIISSAAPFVMALVLILISSGNINKATKQNEILADNFTELVRIVDEITTAFRDGGMPKTLEFVRDNKERAAKAVEELRGVCDYFEKITVPGALKDKLEAVRAGIPAMRDFLDKYENMFHAVMLEREFKEYVSEMSASVSELENEGSFIIAEQAFMRELNRLNSRKKGLMWL